MTENSEMGRLRPRSPTRPVPIASSVTPGPPVPNGQVIERPRLLERLARAVDDAALTVLSAPAGSGKTVLAAQWAETRQGLPVAWTNVTDRDDNPRAFWWHVRAALGRAGAVDTGDGVQLFPGADEADWLVHQLLRTGRPVVLVLDAAHRLRHRVVFDELARLLDGAAGVLRVLITTRHDPPLPLHRYRLAGTMAELGADDLAFTRPELGTLLEAHGVTRADDVVGELLVRTEGWAAGARIGAMMLQSGTSGADLVDLASHYLVPEVFDGLGKPEQRLLLRVSVVDEVDHGLAVALTGQPDAERLLVGLSRRNAFVQPVRGRSRSYRLHPLFREVLARRRPTGTPDHDDLHRRASEWFAADRQLLPAVDHAVAAHDWERAAACTIEIDGLVDLLVPTSAGSVLAAVLSPMPAAGLTGSADVRLVLAALALRDGDVGLARMHLTRCASEAEVGERAMWAAVVSTCLAASEADADATLRAADAARQHGCDRVGSASAALVRHAEGTAQLVAGDLDTAGTILEAAASAADASGRTELRSRSIAMLALVEACRGQLCRADELAHLVERLVGDGDAQPPVALDLARAWVALDRQDLSRAQHALHRARRTREATDAPMLRPISVLLAARLKRDHGDGAAARALLQQVAPRAGWLRQSFDAEAGAVGVPTSHTEAEEQRGRSSSAAGAPDPARPSAQVEQLLARARVHLLQADAHACRADVAHALALARGERLRRPFTHAAPEIRAMIRSDRELRASANWLRPDRSSGTEGRMHPEAPAPPVEMLSERELEVLRHLSALLTTEEIAAEMFISANTVRTHVRRILGKLSVSRRHEAVRRARELRLV